MATESTKKFVAIVIPLYLNFALYVPNICWPYLLNALSYVQVCICMCIWICICMGTAYCNMYALCIDGLVCSDSGIRYDTTKMQPFLRHILRTDRIAAPITFCQYTISAMTL